MKADSLAIKCLVGLALFSQLGCEEDRPSAKETPKVETKTQEALVEKPVETPPHLIISESGPSVRGMSVMLTQPNGNADNQGRAKLKTYLEEEKKFIEGKEITVVVDRQAKPTWVSTFLSELSGLGPAKVLLATETRTDFPKQVEFVPQEMVHNADPCSLVGTITEDRGTAIWKISGGTARKRGRGMGGPDLSMTAETIESMKKGCSSDLFFVTAVDGVEWGLVYDLAASAMILDKADLKRAIVPTKIATAGHKVEL